MDLKQVRSKLKNYTLRNNHVYIHVIYKNLDWGMRIELNHIKSVIQSTPKSILLTDEGIEYLEKVHNTRVSKDYKIRLMTKNKRRKILKSIEEFMEELNSAEDIVNNLVNSENLNSESKLDILTNFNKNFYKIRPYLFDESNLSINLVNNAEGKFLIDLEIILISRSILKQIDEGMQKLQEAFKTFL